MTGSYSVQLKRSAEKELRAVPKRELERLAAKLKKLSQQPRPPGCEKMSGGNRYRIRQGAWRVVYSVDDETRVVLIFKVGHRRDVYR